MDDDVFYDVATTFAKTVIELVTGKDWDIHDPDHGATPDRFVDLMEALLCRHCQPEPNIKAFDTKCDELIICDPIDYYSLCPHHLALVVGKAYIGYVPNKRALGLSKFPRLVQWLAGTALIQEDLTVQIADKLESILFYGSRPEYNQGVSYGVAVVLRATHYCTLCRGVRINSDFRMQTSKMTGCFLDKTKQARSEFLSLIKL